VDRHPINLDNHELAHRFHLLGEIHDHGLPTQLSSRAELSIKERTGAFSNPLVLEMVELSTPQKGTREDKETLNFISGWRGTS
jgi:hypothetical protein